MKKIIKAVTVPASLGLYRGLMKELSSEYKMVALSSPGTELDNFCISEGCMKLEVPMKRRISLFSDICSLLRLLKAFWSERPDMVHSMTPKAGLLCMMAAWMTRVPVRVHTFTGLVFPTAKGLKRRILMATDWLTCACATQVIPESEGVRNDLLNNHITKKNIKVLGYGNVKGIDLKRFDRTPDVLAVSDTIRTSEKFTFITVGRILSDKGINELVAAFKRLNAEKPNTRLIIVGKDETTLDPLKEETVKELKTNKAIECVGEQFDVRPWYAAADCAVLASYREGCPNVVIEAGAMGLPQIVTDVNGANEIIKDGINGVIIPSKSTTALYRAMISMIENTSDRKAMAANARDMIASRYEQSFVRRCLKDFYASVLPA